ncbi:MAG: hypothetical protein ACK4N5_11150 [Myxococcales bacterium]
MSAFPACGIYRTGQPLGEIPAGRLVYFHNHGDPGPGIYLPKGWQLNRAQWHAGGTTVPDAAWASTLQPLAPEGFYRVETPFTCCEKNCRTYEKELLVQLGYNGEGEAILFVPEWTPSGLAIPVTGNMISQALTKRLVPLRVQSAPELEKGPLN